MLQEVLNKPICFFFPTRPSHLVDGSLGQVLDDVGAIEKTAVEGIGTAKRVATLNDAGVAGEVLLGHAAEGATTC
jgi:hypothetical protein